MADGQGEGTVAPAQRLGAALRALQQRSGRTLRSLEAEVLISDSSLSRYLRGSTVPPWSTVRDLCRALGADPVAYRTLWEAADRSQSAAGPEAPQITAVVPVRVRAPGEQEPKPEPTPTPVRAARWARLRERWTVTVAGVLAGGLLGALLTLFLAMPDRGPAQHSAGPAAAVGPADRPGRSEAVRPFINRATGHCLDHSLDHGLRTYPCNGLSYQRWTVRALPHGAFQVRNHATGSCLNSGASALRVGGCATTPSGTWSVRAWPDESVGLASTATGACVEDGTDGLRPARCGRTDRQRWG
ncbi:helix-turn-helix domain-containing protein [Streptomyces sp. NPDC016845]|uniref:helix-turn-helix domain-containing protein n=1 Tax=Streptomyces sp. NPDC016845 TaxID=3364972 RepID=UPI00378BF028